MKFASSSKIFVLKCSLCCDRMCFNYTLSFRRLFHHHHHQIPFLKLELNLWLHTCSVYDQSRALNLSWFNDYILLSGHRCEPLAKCRNYFPIFKRLSFHWIFWAINRQTSTVVHRYLCNRILKIRFFPLSSLIIETLWLLFALDHFYIWFQLLRRTS